MVSLSSSSLCYRCAQQESFDLPTSSGRLVGRTCAISCLAPQLSPRDTEVELALNSN